MAGFHTRADKLIQSVLSQAFRAIYLLRAGHIIPTTTRWHSIISAISLTTAQILSPGRTNAAQSTPSNQRLGDRVVVDPLLEQLAMGARRRVSILVLQTTEAQATSHLTDLVA